MSDPSRRSLHRVRLYVIFDVRTLTQSLVMKICTVQKDHCIGVSSTGNTLVRECGTYRASRPCYH